MNDLRDLEPIEILKVKKQNDWLSLRKRYLIKAAAQKDYIELIRLLNNNELSKIKVDINELDLQPQITHIYQTISHLLPIKDNKCYNKIITILLINKDIDLDQIDINARKSNNLKRMFRQAELADKLINYFIAYSNKELNLAREYSMNLINLLDFPNNKSVNSQSIILSINDSFIKYQYPTVELILKLSNIANNQITTERFINRFISYEIQAVIVDDIKNEIQDFLQNIKTNLLWRTIYEGNYWQAKQLLKQNEQEKFVYQSNFQIINNSNIVHFAFRLLMNKPKDQNYQNIVKLLIKEQQFDLTIQDEYGRIPLDYLDVNSFIYKQCNQLTKADQAIKIAKNLIKSKGLGSLLNNIDNIIANNGLFLSSKEQGFYRFWQKLDDLCQNVIPKSPEVYQQIINKLRSQENQQILISNCNKWLYPKNESNSFVAKINSKPLKSTVGYSL